jgi:serine/threonine protein kinase
MAVCPNCHEQNPEVGTSCPRCEEYFYVPEDAIDEKDPDPLVGTQAAGKYVILSLISEGGMGAVYRALQLPVEREVAFKVLRTELKDSDNGRDRFIREARAVSRLNHPNIITLYDFGFEDGKHPYMVMEYAPGKSLARWLKTEQVTTDRILRITAQILSALNEAHQHGIVHRDLKPENMIISPKGNDPDRVKLLDFGIARMINEGATKGLTREGEVFGTPDYMAPEQAQGKKSIGPPADIYAVGIMLWEMVCGECPFTAPTPLAVLFMHINDPLPELRPRAGVEVPPALAEMIQRATSKDPQQRYQTAGEMLAEIHSFLAGTPGMLPGFPTGDISREVPLSQLGAGNTPPSGIQPNRSAQHTPVPNRQPHFTPSNTSPGVHVQDPDPSQVVDYPSPQTTPPGQTKKLGIAAVIAVLAVGAAVVALAVVVMSDDGAAETDDAVVESNEPTDTPEDTTEVAVSEKPSDEIQVEPLEPTEEADEPTEEDPAAAEEDESGTDDEVTEDEDSPASETAQMAASDKSADTVEDKPEPKPRPRPRPRPKREKKTEPKKKEKKKPAIWEPKKTKKKKTKVKRWDL